jgi:hypothetical protein
MWGKKWLTFLPRRESGDHDEGPQDGEFSVISIVALFTFCQPYLR